MNPQATAKESTLSVRLGTSVRQMAGLPGRRLRLWRSAWARLRLLLKGMALPVIGLTVVSTGVGLAEGGVLVLVANVAAAMVVHGHTVRGDMGPIGLNITVGLALLVALGLAGVRLLLQVLVAWLPARMSADVATRLRRELFDSYARASWAVQSDERDGQLQELMTGQIGSATQGVINCSNAVSAGVMFIVLLASAFVLSAVVASLVLASSLVLFGALRPIDRLGRNSARELSQASIEYAGAVSTSVWLAEEARVFGAGSAFRRQMGTLVSAVRSGLFRTQFLNGLVQTTYQGAILLLIVGGLAGLYLLHPGRLATLGAVILLLTRTSAYGQQFQAANHGIIQVAPYLDRLSAALERYRASAPAEGGRALGPIRTLALDRVRFAYREGLDVLRDISFSVSAGETIGIIGPTGAGKSTLSQILLRLREPAEGTYLVNGSPASDFSLSSWEQRVAYVGQEPRLFPGTVADNIRFFRDLDQQALEKAAKLAQVHDDIVRMPHGYATAIGQRADAVSGGQRQRICLARALAGSPDVILLDEPTSALDLISESRVRGALASLRGQVTLFIVAHRLPLLEICDRVLVLENGRVQSFAPLRDLASGDGFYRKVLSMSRPAHQP